MENPAGCENYLDDFLIFWIGLDYVDLDFLLECRARMSQRIAPLNPH